MPQDLHPNPVGVNPSLTPQPDSSCLHPKKRELVTLHFQDPGDQQGKKGLYGVATPRAHPAKPPSPHRLGASLPAGSLPFCALKEMSSPAPRKSSPSTKPPRSTQHLALCGSRLGPWEERLVSVGLAQSNFSNGDPGMECWGREKEGGRKGELP